MAFCELKYFSRSLGKAMAANIILPENNMSGPFPVFYLLHGLSDDHTIWMRRTSIERYVQDLPLIVVMPDGGRSFYCDMAEGGAYESSIVKDLVGYVDATFPYSAQSRRARCGRAVYGRLRGCQTRTEIPRGVLCGNQSFRAHWRSGIYPPEAEKDPSRRSEWERILGKNPVGGDNDPFALAAKVPADKRPALRIDCGKDDFLIQQNRDFHKHLDSLGYKHEYEEFQGAHTWDYWDKHVQEAIAFHSKILKIAAK